MYYKEGIKCPCSGNTGTSTNHPYNQLSGFPQTFDNWIQGLFKDFQGQQQQQFSRIYFKERPNYTSPSSHLFLPQNSLLSHDCEQ